jgi:hypothetical protein
MRKEQKQQPNDNMPAEIESFGAFILDNLDFILSSHHPKGRCYLVSWRRAPVTISFERWVERTDVGMSHAKVIQQFSQGFKQVLEETTTIDFFIHLSLQLMADKGCKRSVNQKHLRNFFSLLTGEKKSIVSKFLQENASKLALPAADWNAYVKVWKQPLRLSYATGLVPTPSGGFKRLAPEYAPSAKELSTRPKKMPKRSNAAFFKRKQDGGVGSAADANKVAPSV